LSKIEGAYYSRCNSRFTSSRPSTSASSRGGRPSTRIPTPPISVGSLQASKIAPRLSVAYQSARTDQIRSLTPAERRGWM